MSRNLIRWTDEEREMLVTEALKIHTSWPHYSELELIRRAQFLLPNERRRTFDGNHQIKWFSELLKQAKASAKAFKEPQKIIEEVKPDLKQMIVGLLTELGTDILKEVVSNIKNNIKNEPFYTEQESEPAERLYKVFIYGLLPNQANIVRTQFKDCLDFRFLKNGTSKQLISGAKWADKIVLMTKFISHDYDAIKKYDIAYCDGGVTELTNILEGMYLEQE